MRLNNTQKHALDYQLEFRLYLYIIEFLNTIFVIINYSLNINNNKNSYMCNVEMFARARKSVYNENYSFHCIHTFIRLSIGSNKFIRLKKFKVHYFISTRITFIIYDRRSTTYIYKLNILSLYYLLYSFLRVIRMDNQNGIFV